MADRTEPAELVSPSNLAVRTGGVLVGLHVDGQNFAANSYVDTTVSDGANGNSFRLGPGARWRWRAPCPAGSVTVSARVYQPQASAERPQMRILASPEIGVTLTSVDAPASTEWSDVSVSFTSTGAGGIYVELVNPSTAYPCWWDSIQVA